MIIYIVRKPTLISEIGSTVRIDGFCETINKDVSIFASCAQVQWEDSNFGDGVVTANGQLTLKTRSGTLVVVLVEPGTLLSWKRLSLGGGGTPGPQGPQGPQGEKGDPGDVANADVPGLFRQMRYPAPVGVYFTDEIDCSTMANHSGSWLWSHAVLPIPFDYDFRVDNWQQYPFQPFGSFLQVGGLHHFELELDVELIFDPGVSGLPFGTSPGIMRCQLSFNGDAAIETLECASRPDSTVSTARRLRSSRRRVMIPISLDFSSDIRCPLTVAPKLSGWADPEDGIFGKFTWVINVVAINYIK